MILSAPSAESIDIIALLTKCYLVDLGPTLLRVLPFSKYKILLGIDPTVLSTPCTNFIEIVALQTVEYIVRD